MLVRTWHLFVWFPWKNDVWGPGAIILYNSSAKCSCKEGQRSEAQTNKHSCTHTYRGCYWPKQIAGHTNPLTRVTQLIGQTTNIYIYIYCMHIYIWIFLSNGAGLWTLSRAKCIFMEFFCSVPLTQRSWTNISGLLVSAMIEGKSYGRKWPS